MDKGVGLLRLFGWHVKLDLSRAMMYRGDFVAGLLVSVFFAALGPFIQYLLFTQTNGYPGWTFEQILLFQGMLLLWGGIRDTLFGEVRPKVTDLVWKGDFDRLLLRPFPPIGLLMTGGFRLEGIGPVFSGIAVMIYAGTRLDLAIKAWTLPLFALLIVSGVILYAAFTILYCAIVLMIVQMSRIGEMFDNLFRFSEYPVNIYPQILRLLLVTALPFAVWTYFPVRALLGQAEWTMGLGFAFSVLALFASLAVWNRCLKKYASAGG